MTQTVPGFNRLTVPGFNRLTVEADKRGGQPCIRGYRFSAEQLLGLLRTGLEQIRALEAVLSRHW